MPKTPDASELQALFGMPPRDAVDFLRAKGLRITFDASEMLDEAHARAFTVAKAMRLDVLRDIRKGLLDALEQGKTLRQFSNELTPLLQKKGWWGKQVFVDGQGQAQMAQLGSPWRLRTIYQTNLQSAYMAGRAKAQAASRAVTHLMYVAVLDSRTRRSHRELHGRIWRKDDPIWELITPPNGYGCRCRTRALTRGQMLREGLVASPPAQLQWRDVETDGKLPEWPIPQQLGVRVQTDAGAQQSMWVDVGFASSPLAGHGFDQVLTSKAVAALGGEAGFAQVREWLLSATRLRAWQAFVDGAYSPGFRGKNDQPVVQGQTMTVGLLPLNVIHKAQTQGIGSIMPVLSASDRLLVGKKAQRHQAAGNALSMEQWISLPDELVYASWYLDTRSGNLAAVIDNGSGKVIKALFDPKSGTMDTAFTVTAEDITSAVNGGIWKTLGGQIK